MDIWTSWIFGCHGYLDIIDSRTSWIYGHHGYSDIIDIMNILGDTTFSGKIDLPDNYAFEALSMQSCIAKQMQKFIFETLALQVPGGHF